MKATKNSPKLLLRIACCLGMCLPLSAVTALAQQVMELKESIHLERSLVGGQSQDYRVHLEAGQLLHAVVEQEGIDVEVILTGPDGKQIGHIDSLNSSWGPEPMV